MHAFRRGGEARGAIGRGSRYQRSEHSGRRRDHHVSSAGPAVQRLDDRMALVADTEGLCDNGKRRTRVHVSFQSGVACSAYK